MFFHYAKSCAAAILLGIPVASRAAIVLSSATCPQSGSTEIGVSQWEAQAFIASPDTESVIVDALSLRVDVVQPNAHIFVGITTSAASGFTPDMDNVLIAFDPTPLQSTSTGTTTLTPTTPEPTDPPVLLTVGLQYWIVFGAIAPDYDQDPANGLYRWAYAASRDAIIEPDGWSIAANYASSGSQGSHWTQSNGAPYLFSLTMTPVPEPALLPLALALIALLCVGCRPKSTTSESPEPPPADAIAQINGQWLLSADLDAFIATNPQFPDRQSAQSALIAEAQLAALAHTILADDPAFRAATRQFAAQRFVQSNLELLPPPDDDAIHDLYQQRIAEFTTPPTFGIAVIRKAFQPDSKNQALAALEQARTAFLATNPTPPFSGGFGSIATQFSDHNDSRFVGGRCGTIRPNQPHRLLPPALCTHITAADAPGLLPDIHVYDNAAWLVLITHIQPPSTRSLDAVKPLLRQSLATQQQQQQRAALKATAAAAFPAATPNR